MEISSLYSIDRRIKWSSMFRSINEVFDKNIVLSQIKDKNNK